MEPINNRLSRLMRNGLVEISGTITESLRNFMLPEIAALSDKQSYTIFLTTHAVIQIVGEKIMALEPVDATRWYLREFVDGGTADTRFSDHAAAIHNWRNVVAHAWLSKFGYEVGIDETMDKGADVRDGVVFINASIYRDHFVRGFGRIRGSALVDAVSPDDDLVRTLQFCRRFMELPRSDAISVALKSLERETDPTRLREGAEDIKRMFAERFPTR